MEKFIKITTLILFLSSLNLKSNDFRFENVSTNDGLINEMVSEIYQDTRGFIWITTFSGVSRFDGYSFKNYEFIADCEECISNPSVHCIAEDKNSNIWIGTENGLNRLNYSTGSWDKFLNEPVIDRFSKSHIKDIYFLANDTIMLATYGNGVILFDEKTQAYKRLKLVENEPEHLRINGIDIDSDSNFWFSCEDYGVIYYNTKTRKGKRFFKSKEHFRTIVGNYFKKSPTGATEADFDRFLNSENLSPNLTANSVIEVAKDTFCISTWNDGLYFLDLKTESFYIDESMSKEFRNLMKGLTVRDMFLDEYGMLWLASFGRGLILLDRKSGEHSVFMNESSNPSSIGYDFLWTIFKDRSNNIWLGSFGGGLSKLNITANSFKVIQSGFRNRNHVRRIVQIDDSSVLLSINGGGLYVYNLKTNNLSPLPDSDLEQIDMADMVLSKDTTLWTATAGKVISKNFKKNTSKTYINRTDSSSILKWAQINALEEDLDGNIWVGVFFDGIYCIEKTETLKEDPGNVNYKKLAENQQDSVNLSSLKYFDFIATPDGFVWAGSDIGLLKFKNPAESYIHYLNNVSINNMAYSNGVIWIATYSDGLIKLNTANDQTEFFNTTKGLLDNNINSILFENDSILWYACRKGIGRININTLEINNFNIGSLFRITNFQRNAMYMTSGGVMLFGTNNGLLLFDPKNIVFNESKSGVYITDLFINSRSVFDLEQNEWRKNIRKRDITNYDTIFLHPNDRTITFEFATDNYSNPENIAYEYMLDNFDQEWTRTDASNRRITYTNLSGGKYTFKVRVADMNDSSPDYVTSLNLFVKPPLYKTLWFKIGIVFILGFLIVMYYLRRINIVKQMNIELARKVDERTIEIRDKNSELEEKQKHVMEQAEELRASNEQLMQTNATKDRLLSIIAHDLKNPLGLILGFSEFLASNIEELDVEKRSIYLHSINNSAEKTYNLLENLLNWAVSKNEFFDFNPQNIVLKEIIDENISLLSEHIKRKNISLQKEIDETIVLWADSNMVNTVLRNLLINAVKYTDMEGQIKIKSKIVREREKVLISIEDNGVGIKEENIDKIFNMDFSVSTAGTQGEQGTGLGLLLCKEFIEKHGEKIWVESIPKLGSKFFFTLKLSKNEQK